MYDITLILLINIKILIMGYIESYRDGWDFQVRGNLRILTEGESQL